MARPDPAIGAARVGRVEHPYPVTDSSGDAECVFCDLIDSGHATWVARRDLAVAFAPRPDSAISPGHTLVVPRSHCDAGVLDVDAAALVASTRLVQDLGRVMLDVLGATGVCVLNASGPGSGRSVDHLHLHVVPRFPGDPDSTLPWPSGRSPHRVDGDPHAILHERMESLFG